MLGSATARRLTFAFTSLMATFGVASYFALSGLAELHRGLHHLKHLEEGVRDALELSNAARARYLGEDGAAQRADDRLRRLSSELKGEQGSQMEEIASANRALDQSPERARELASIISRNAEQIADQLDNSMGNFEEHGATVQHSAVRWTLGFLLGTTLFALGIGIYIGRSVSRPLRRLEEGASRLERGDLDARIIVDGHDEFARLAQQFNQMAAALKSDQAKLVESEKLAGIGRLAAGVAHEINNPLGVILGYLRVLRRDAQPPLADDLTVIETEAVRCQEIVEGLLDLARPVKQTDELIDLRAMCNEVIGRLRDAHIIGTEPIEVIGGATTRGNPTRLRQVITNLIKNAVEASRPSGTVTVRVVEQLVGGAQVCVEDTGPGVAAADRAHLFEPFFTTKAGGTGLGLAVSQAIARAHGGRIDFENAEPRGARFTLRLPSAEQPA